MHKRHDAWEAAEIDKITGHIPPHSVRHPQGPVGPPLPPGAGPGAGPGTAPPIAPPKAPPVNTAPPTKAPPKRKKKGTKGYRSGGGGKGGSKKGVNWTNIALGALGGYALNNLMSGQGLLGGGRGSGGGNTYNYNAGKRGYRYYG